MEMFMRMLDKPKPKKDGESGQNRVEERPPYSRPATKIK
jgi:hypothetical protein